MLLTKTVEVKWCRQNKEHYENLHYHYSGNLKSFIVKVEDLSPQSHVDVEMLCDKCKKHKRILPFREYKKYFERTYICKECEKKLKFKQIKDDFEAKGYIVLSTIDEYENCFSKIRYICKKHFDNGEQQITVASFNQGSGCKYCGIKKASDKHRTSYDEVNQLFKSKGLILLTEDYKNADQLLNFICVNHKEMGIQQIRYRALCDGQGCKYCGYERTSESLKFSYEFVKNEFEKRDLMLLDEVYIDSRTPLRYICKHHPNVIETIEFRALYNQNQGCRLCYLDNNSGENSPNWKGGISELSKYLRQSLIEWKKESFKKCNYKCIITGNSSNGKFEVHHLLSVNTIIDNIINKLNLDRYKNINKYPIQILKEIENLFIIENNKLYGFVLSPQIHCLYHKNFGYGNNTPKQFNKFKLDYYNGVYDEELEEEIKSYNSIKRLKALNIWDENYLKEVS